MGLFGSALGGAGAEITATFVGKDGVTPVIQKMRAEMTSLGSKSSGPLGGVLGAVGNLGGALGATGVAFGGLMAAATIGGDVLGEFAAAGAKAEATDAKLTTSLNDNVKGWQKYSGALDDATSAGVQLGFTQDDLKNSQALLVVQTHDVNAAIAAQQVAMDLARLKGIDLATATTIVGKAFLGNTTALKKMGIEVAKGTTGMAALAAVEKVAGGQADAFSHTFEGSIARNNAELDRFGENIGTKVLLPLTNILNLVDDVAFGPAPSTPPILKSLEQFGPTLHDLGQESASDFKVADDAVQRFDSTWRSAAINVVKSTTTMAAGERAGLQGMIKSNRSQFKTLEQDEKGYYSRRKQALAALPKEMVKAQNALNFAERTGDANLIAEAKALVASLDAQWNRLNGTVTITSVVGGGAGRVGARVRASGGPVYGGATYIVGENGPEVLHMGNGPGGYVTQGRSGGGNPTVIHTHVYLDGREIASSVDKRIGMSWALSGQSSTRN